MLKLYSSNLKDKVEFKPLVPGKVSLYVCGNTVYDYCHMGHARTMVCFDVIVRYLRASGFDVTYVRNITDIDDKIIERANENNEPFSELTVRMIEAQREDERALNLLTPDLEPKATENIDEIITLIEDLIEKGFAYVGESGDVYFEVDKFEAYGKLSKKDLSGQMAGMRVAVETDKKAPLDFVLWKKAKANEPSWESPWGLGRPGWHIECSAMSMKCLGETFDIHGGGFDLQFPHHENELAQSEAATGKPFAMHWMHVGFLQINQEKMSKSLGNFFTIKDVLKSFHPEVVRYFLLSSHYRSQLNYSDEALANAKAALLRLYQSLSLADSKNLEAQKTDKSWQEKFHRAMDDDFNTPKALAVLFELAHEINRLVNEAQQDKALSLCASLKALAAELGILQGSYETVAQADSSLDKEKIETLIKRRDEARANKQWQTADELRSELEDLGIVLEDKDGRTSWRVK